MNEHAHISANLTKNQLLVIDDLTSLDGPQAEVIFWFNLVPLRHH